MYRVTFLSLVVVLFGCDGGDPFATDSSDGSDTNNGRRRSAASNPNDPNRQSSPLSLTAGVEPMSGCSAVEEYFEEKMTRYVNGQLENAFENSKYWRERVTESVASVQPASDAASTMEAGNDTPENYTTTNNQVAGVEEADFVKNTGTHIFHLAFGKLHILKSWPADQLTEISSLDFEGSPQQMLLAGDRLMVLSQPTSRSVGMSDVGHWSWYRNDSSQVDIIDISDLTKPKVISTHIYQGNWGRIRRVGNTARLVFNNHIPYPTKVKTYLTRFYEAGVSEAELAKEVEEQKVRNEAAVREQSVEYWLAGYSNGSGVANSQDVDKALASDCANFFAPTIDSELGMTRIVSLDLQTGAESQTVLLANSVTIYSSQSTMYLVTPYHWWSDLDRDRDYSFIHAFDVSPEATASYLGSGGVEGLVLNQFSLDEHDGHLRVATTVTDRIRLDPEEESWWWGDWNTRNRVTVLRLQDQILTEVGKTPDLAESERIYSARFDGNRGFIVTFRQVDPLFAIDFSDPTDPKVLGELKIPGFSNYMQFIDENHLLTVGQEATMEGRITGLKLSIFNVSDMTQPKEAHTFVLDGFAQSDAQWDHKAFTYFPTKKLLAIPVRGYLNNCSQWWRCYSSALMVFDIDPGAGISHRGNVEANDLYQSGTPRTWSWWSWRARVKRSIFADDFLYAISNFGIRVVRSDDLVTPVATVRYQCDQVCEDGW